MKSIRSIAADIYDTCKDVDRNITGHGAEDAAAWAAANSARHAHTIRAILSYHRRTGKAGLRILNASGLSCGHQDFSVAGFLRRRAGIPVEWTAFESPNSRFLANSRFREYVASLDIRVELSDFSRADEPYGPGLGVYDIVIFTEIAEHLDHTTLLKALGEIRNKMKDDGMIVVTTPNLVSLVNRLRILFGNGDGPFFGDGNRNRAGGLYGHIVNYDLRRMTRLMRDAGYAVAQAYTFNSYFCRPLLRGPAGRTLVLALGAATRLVRNSGGTLFIAAGKGEAAPIPFET